MTKKQAAELKLLLHKIYDKEHLNFKAYELKGNQLYIYHKGAKLGPIIILTPSEKWLRSELRRVISRIKV